MLSFPRYIIATITRTESKTWKAIIRRKGWPHVSKTFRIKRDAEDWARTTEDEIRRGIYIHKNASERLTILEALDRYLREVTPTKKESTQRGDKDRANQIKLELGKYSMAALNADVISKYRDRKLAKGKANNTVRLDLALLSNLYTVAIKEWGLGLTVNPVSNVRKPSAGAGRNRRLEKHEEKRLLKACDEHSNPFLGWIVRLALYTAMRKGEVVSLTRTDIDLDRRTILLKDTKNNDSRTVPLTDKAYNVVQEVLDFPIRPIDTEYLFFGEPGKDGQRKPYVINRVWSKVIKKAEVEDFRFHDLRHEATSRFVEAGLSDQEVSSITGHKSMQMLRKYTHLRNENLVTKISSI